MTSEPEPDDVLDQEAVEIKADLSCMRCGYILRGLPARGRCPECGESIEKSLRGDLLRFAEARWFRMIARGVAAVRWSVLVFFLAFLGYLVALTGLAIVTIVSAEPTVGEQLFTAGMAVASIIWTLAPFGMAVGLWWLMAPEPRAEAEAVGLTALRRALAAAVVPVLLLGFVLGSGRVIVGPLSPIIGLVAVQIAAAVVVAQTYMNHDRSMEFERRCEKPPRYARSRRGRYRKRGLLIIAGLFYVLYLIGPARFVPAGGTPGWRLPNDMSHTLLLLVLGIMWLSSTSMLGQLRKAIRIEQAAASA